ncbi:MAG: hypothetical protein AAFQ80_20000 [Cyanobacteria bacterium J06621_8]
MFSTEDFINMAIAHGRETRPCLAIITVFCCVDDLWNQITQGRKIRKGGFEPSLRDSEVITMEIVLKDTASHIGEFLGIETDKGIWCYFRAHWLDFFPQIKSRTTFSRPASNLWCYKQQLQKLLVHNLGGLEDSIHIIDGFPMPLCHYLTS